MFKKLFGHNTKSVDVDASKATIDKVLANRINYILHSGLFDANWYREVNHIDARDDASAVRHYIETGDGAGSAPHPLFDVEYYRQSSADMMVTGLTALEHYIRVGAAKGLSPNPMFDPQWYRDHASDAVKPDDDAFRHFLHRGALSGVSPHPLFDSGYYFGQDNRLSSGGINPLTHYVGCGAVQGRNPNPLFDSGWYLASNPDVHRSGQNPLRHFIVVGAAVGLKPHPDVNIREYILLFDDVPQDPLQAYIHLVTTGHTRLVKRPPRAALVGVEQTARDDRPLERLEVRDFQQVAGALVAGDRAPPVPRSQPAKIAPHENVALVTVDIWDTVLRRDCHPDEIKAQSARYLLLRHGPLLKTAFAGLLHLLNARIAAENASAPNDEYEFRFEQAVDAWLDVVLQPGVTADERRQVRAELLAHEMASEQRATRVDQPMRAALRKMRLPLIYASDFYMSSRFLSDLLDHHGVRNHFVRGYVSSDTYETKRSGRMFDRILADAQVEAGQLLHIGDNGHADVAVPSKMGIATVHYLIDGESERRAWFDKAFSAWRRQDNSVHERRIMAIVEDLAGRADNGTPKGALAATGIRLAPLVAGFVLNIMETAIRLKLDRVHYFTREGLFFRQVHDALAAADPYNMRYPASDVLAVSRRVTFAASLPDVAPGSLMRLWTLYSKQSLRGLSASLNLDDDEVDALAEAAGIDPTEVIEYPWRNEDYVKFLKSPSFRRLAEGRVAEQRNTLKAYLASKGITDQQALLIADIGWRGTIQDNLAHLLPKTFLFGQYLGLFNFLNAQPSNLSKSGWVFDEPHGMPANIGDVAPFEMLFNGPGGSVVGYDVAGSTVTPRTVVFDGEERIVTGPIAQLQASLLSAIRPIADYMRLHSLVAADLRPLGGSLAEVLSHRPPTAVADVFRQLHHNETFGTGAVDEVQGADDLEQALTGHRGADLHAAVTTALDDIAARQRWPEGQFRTSTISDWWRKALPEQRAHVPTRLSTIYAPAAIKARGANLAVFAPAPIVASGGHRTIFNMLRRLARIGFNPVVFLEGIGAGVNVVEDYLAGTSATIHTQWHKHIPSDAAFATIAHSAPFVAELRNTHHRGYLVQDFEALFNPMSDGYVVAENSYAQGLQHFTIGNWLTHVINTRYGAASAPAGLGVDTATYHVIDSDDQDEDDEPLSASGAAAAAAAHKMTPAKASTRADGAAASATTSTPVATAVGVGASAKGAAEAATSTRPKRELAVCFLYQPDKPRRTPVLGIDALRLVKRRMPECKIYVFGSNLPLHLDFEVENLGLITNLAELNALYNRCVAGLCVSGSNPSRIPYEMMAAGCVPVDVYRYNNLLDHKPGTILLAYQNQHSIAAALLEVLGDADKARAMSRAARRFVAPRTLDWEVDVISNNLLALMQGELPPFAMLDQLIYDQPPIIVAEHGNEQAMRKFCDSQLAAARQRPQRTP